MEPPTRSSRSRFLAALRQLLSSEPLDQAEPAKPKGSFLGWILSPEPLPLEEPPPPDRDDPTAGPVAFLKWILGPEPLDETLAESPRESK